MIDIEKIKLGDIVAIDFREVVKDKILPLTTMKNLVDFDNEYYNVHTVKKIINEPNTKKVELEEDFWFFQNELYYK
jgi:hypothetical protein